MGERINKPQGLDVTFANGGLTGPGGHPAEIAKANVARGIWRESDGEGAFFFSVANAADISAALTALLSSKPDLIKTYLLYSEEYVERLRDSKTFGWRGLDPALMPVIVEQVHRAGLRVAAHVESAADFHVAVAAGVDQIAHVPGFRGDANGALPDPRRYCITVDDARVAGRRGIVVVTTLAGLAKYADEKSDAALRRAADQLNIANLSLLKRSGAPIAIGSDEYADTSVREALYLNELGIFTPAELLRIWTHTTPQAIFSMRAGGPKRRIGDLAVGYEASFLSLAGNPLVDFSSVTRIRLRVKQGEALSLRESGR
jgi:hypothetical protein